MLTPYGLNVDGGCCSFVSEYQVFMPFLTFSIISIILFRLHYMAAEFTFYVSYVFIIQDDEIIKMIMVRLFEMVVGYLCV